MWGMEEKRIKCMLCGKPASLEHVLSSCQASLADGKVRWSHDQILAELTTGLEEERRKTPNSTKMTSSSPFDQVR